MSSPKFKVAICGAGIGGLTLAVALMRYPDIEVEIFEGASRLGEVGAGIGLFPRVWGVLQQLGLDAELLQYTEQTPTNGPTPAFRYRKSDQPAGRDLFTLHTTGKLLMFHRADFQSVLLRRLGDRYRLQTSKRLRSYSQSSSSSSSSAAPIKLSFEDGSTAECDLLIGADGLRSAVRRVFLTDIAQKHTKKGQEQEAHRVIDAVDPVWCGTNAYRSVIPAERLAALSPGHPALTTPTQYLGHNAYVLCYPIQHGAMINFIAFDSRHDLENTKINRPMVLMGDNTSFAPIFQNWEPEVKSLVNCAHEVMNWAIHTIKPLDSFVSGRICLLGDSAHAMVPHQGSGAGQAIEDAFILATILGHHRVSSLNLDVALSVYDQIRRPMAQDVQARSRINGQLFTLYPDVNIENLERDVTRNWEWTWTTTVESMEKRAVVLLESTL